MHALADVYDHGIEVSLVVDLLRAGRAVHFRAEGDSMHPVIRSGDRLHVQPAGEARDNHDIDDG